MLLCLKSLLLSNSAKNQVFKELDTQELDFE